MSPSLSWIDPGALEAALAGLEAKQEAKPAERAPERRPLVLRPPPAVEREPEPPPEPISAAPLAPSFPPGMSVSERLALLVRWIELVAARAPFFVADPEGLVMHSRGVPEPQVLASVALDRALRPVRGLLGAAQVGSLVLELDDGILVQVVWGSTRLGRAAVGVLPPRPLDQARVEQIREALRRVFEW